VKIFLKHSVHDWQVAAFGFLLVNLRHANKDTEESKYATLKSVSDVYSDNLQIYSQLFNKIERHGHSSTMQYHFSPVYTSVHQLTFCPISKLMLDLVELPILQVPVKPCSSSSYKLLFYLIMEDSKVVTHLSPVPRCTPKIRPFFITYQLYHVLTLEKK
jgi:hypothetical protein